MDYLETIKKDVNEKYQKMLDGTYKCPIKTVKPISASQFILNDNAFHKRLDQERKKINNAFKLINKNKTQRLAQEEQRNEEARRERERRQQELRLKVKEIKERLKKFIIWTVVLALIAGVVLAIKSCNDKNDREEQEKHGVSNIQIKVTSFENAGYSGYYYISKLKVSVKNNCTVGLSYLSGSMKIEGADNHNVLWSGTYNLTGSVSASGGTEKWDLELKSNTNIFNGYTYERLNIYMTIESAQFSDIWKYYDNTEYVKIHSGSANYKKIVYQQGVSLYNRWRYSETLSKFESLGNYTERQKAMSDYSSNKYKKTDIISL